MSVPYANFSQFFKFGLWRVSRVPWMFLVQCLGNTVSEPSSGWHYAVEKWLSKDCGFWVLMRLAKNFAFAGYVWFHIAIGYNNCWKKEKLTALYNYALYNYTQHTFENAAVVKNKFNWVQSLHWRENCWLWFKCCQWNKNPERNSFLQTWTNLRHFFNWKV